MSTVMEIMVWIHRKMNKRAVSYKTGKNALVTGKREREIAEMKGLGLQICTRLCLSHSCHDHRLSQFLSVFSNPITVSVGI